MQPLLQRLRRAAAIALGRHEWRPPPASARAGTPDVEGFLCVIDRFSMSHGMLRIAGWALHPGARTTALELRLPGGGRYPIRRFGLPSPDLVPTQGIGAAKARFDETLAVTEPSGEVLRAVLAVGLEGKPEKIVGELGAPNAADAAHALLPRFLEMLRERPQGHFLEIGSRARSGVVRRDLVPEGWRYTGLDVLAGENVDVVGDAHQASRLLPHGAYDAVMAISVLEHLLMPWKFAVELNRVLKTGAVGFFLTHQSWPMHDRPWDFWRFSDTAWAALFNASTGFEIIATGLGERAYLVAEKCHPTTDFAEAPCYGASGVLFRKTGETTLDWPVDLQDVLRTAYPA